MAVSFDEVDGIWRMCGLWCEDVMNGEKPTQFNDLCLYLQRINSTTCVYY